MRTTSAVLAVDVVGYTILMEADEDDTHARLMRLRATLLDPRVAKHGGRVVKNTGDGFLATFTSARQAVTCAVELQRALLEAAGPFPPDRRILFRMGLNYCETIVEDTDIYGGGVNVAARLMAYAEPGDIVLSAVIADLAASAMADMPVFDLGELFLKNIQLPVRALGIRLGSAGKVAAPRLLGQADTRPSIAVLPFKISQRSKSERLCAEGVVDEITHTLASLRELFVVSGGSTFRYARDQTNLGVVGRELGVRYLLQGSVRSIGTAIRVQTELVEAATGQILLTERHEGATAEIFDLQAAIAFSVIKSIVPNIRERELSLAVRKHPESLTAYDLVLQAKQHLNRLDTQSHARARGLLQQAITMDPHYAPAYSYLAYWHIFHVGEGISRDPQSDAVEAARVARAAIERNEQDALARAIFGHVQSFLFGDYEAARSHFDRAIKDGPNCAEAWSMSSVTMGFLGDGRAAVERANHGLRLSPLDAHLFYKVSCVAQAHYVDNQFEAAAVWARKAQAHNPGALFNDRVLIASLSALGRLSEAQKVAEAMLERDPAFQLSAYRQRCPFRREALELWIGRLSAAGLPN